MADCVFCHDARTNDRIHINEYWVSVWDAYPAASGHALIVLRRHVEDLMEVRTPEWNSLWDIFSHTLGVIYRLFPGVTAQTVGFNDGPAAGRTVDHLHGHVIPRRPGDVDDPRGGIRNVLPSAPRPWEEYQT